MLQSLNIRNVALVEGALIEFNAGLNVITGETGAGKSILIGALGLALGERADRDLIRGGAESCQVEAVFQLSEPGPLNDFLGELGAPACEGGTLLIRRTVSASGGNRIHVNDAAVTLQTLKRLGERLVDLHGPHDHQALLDPAYQIRLLDAYGRLNERRERYAAAYRAMRGLQARLAELAAGSEEDAAREIERIEFQVREIEEAALAWDEELKLRAEHDLLGNAQRVMELAAIAREALTEGEHCAFAGLVSGQQALAGLEPMAPEARAWREEARSAAVQVKAISESLASFVARIDGDPARLQWLDERLALYRRLQKKYGGDTSRVLEALRSGQERLADLRARGERIGKLEREIAEARKEVEALGLDLRKARIAAGARLAAAIGRELKGLGFASAGFDASLQPAEPGASGMDEADFGFAPNPGEPVRPLRAIASSGEVSRVMLAVKTVLSKLDPVPVLVFDEIDVNIGGRTATAVGARLAALAGVRQVICITHLPQVAAHGQTHFAVEKTIKSGRTLTCIRTLDNDGRVVEIARMLGGREATPVTLQHARELLGKK